jgi:glycosyltransferase involved in cell wall biosynthesis
MTTLKVHKNPALENELTAGLAFNSKNRPRALAVTLSIAFYNNLPLMEMQLENLKRQTFGTTADTRGLKFEVLICDDGSSAEVVEKVQALMRDSPLCIKHLWHEDKGFRKNRLLNWGLFHSDSDYMIFIDQDCLLHPEFIREHYLARQPRSVLCGRRMELTPWVSKMLSPQKLTTGFIEKNLWWIVLQGLPFKDTHGSKGVYTQNSLLRKFANRTPRGILGCNFSLFRQELLKINGFDHRYEAPGTGEDSDIDYRLTLGGIKKIPMISKAVQYHVFHKLSARFSENARIFAEVKKSQQPVTPFGLSQQLNEARISPQEMQGPPEAQQLPL